MNNKSLSYIILTIASLCLSTQSTCMEQQIIVAPNHQSTLTKSVDFAQQPTVIQQLQPQNIQQVQQQQNQITEHIYNAAIHLTNKYSASKSCLNTKRKSINNVFTMNTKARLTTGDDDIYNLGTAGKATLDKKLYFTCMSAACLFIYLLTIVQVLG